MKSRKGLTLIEVIISIAIIGMIAVSMLGIFDTGLMNITRAGKRTETVLDVKDGIDMLILTNDDTITTNTYETYSISDIETTVTIEIDPDNSPITTEIMGNLAEVKKLDDRDNLVYIETVIVN